MDWCSLLLLVVELLYQKKAQCHSRYEAGSVTHVDSQHNYSWWKIELLKFLYRRFKEHHQDEDLTVILDQFQAQ